MKTKGVLGTEDYVSQLSKKIINDSSNKLFLPFENEIKAVASYYIDIENALINNNPKEALRCSRLTAEAICKHLYYIRLNKESSEISLNDLIYELIKLDEINKVIKPHFKILQSFGNIASHHILEGDDEITIEYAEPCVKSAAYIIRWYFKKFNLDLEENEDNQDIDEIEWNKASEINTIEAYQKYISLNMERKHFDQALNKISELQINNEEDDRIWKVCKEKNTSQGYKEYLLKNPTGKYTVEASRLFVICQQNEIYDKEQWENTVKRNTLLAYEEYISGNSIKRYLDLAKIRVFELKEVKNNYYYNQALYIYKNASNDSDYKKAKELFSLSAEKGNRNAMEILAYMYLNGQGTLENRKLAYSWYKKLADAGSAEGQRRLGDAYNFGDTVTADDKKAAYWYTKAAKQGNDFALIGLAFLYKYGTGVKKDLNMAYNLLNKAKELGNKEAEVNLYRVRELIKKKNKSQ